MHNNECYRQPYKPDISKRHIITWLQYSLSIKEKMDLFGLTIPHIHQTTLTNIGAALKNSHQTAKANINNHAATAAKLLNDPTTSVSTLPKRLR